MSEDYPVDQLDETLTAHCAVAEAFPLAVFSESRRKPRAAARDGMTLD